MKKLLVVVAVLVLCLGTAQSQSQIPIFDDMLMCAGVIIDGSQYCAPYEVGWALQSWAGRPVEYGTLSFFVNRQPTYESGRVFALDGGRLSPAMRSILASKGYGPQGVQLDVTPFPGALEGYSFCDGTEWWFWE